MNVLVTGANGFVGRHLIDQLLEQGHSVVAIGGAMGAQNPLNSGISFLPLDLMDRAQVDTIDFTKVDGVIHLAGLAAVGPSFDDPMLYINTNIGIQVNLFEAAIKQGATPRFVVISSGSLYNPNAELPLTETSKVSPSSPYAASKIGQEQMGLYYGQRGFECIIARPFNHCGPGQGPGFIVPDLAQQLVEVEQGKSTELRVGNLEAQRDYTDVRDIVRAYALLLEKGTPNQMYNICSGTPRSGQVILDALLANSEAKPTVAQNPDLMRPSDNPVIYGSYQKLKDDTGWEPSIAFEQTMSDVIADWRNR